MKTIQHTLLAASLLAASVASAAINIGTVPVGNAGNVNDESTGYGGVSYDYHIGTYEVTNAQYAMFLNSVAFTDTHGLWNNNMGTDLHGGISRSGSDGSYTYSVRIATSGFNDGKSMGNKPVNFVSFWDAARFANWLTNGQPTGAQGNGTTEDGMYNLGGVTHPTNTSVTRQFLGQNGVAIASENEWYKAAYYDGSGGYTLYPTQSDTAPTAAIPPGGTNSANFLHGPGTVTDVGAYTESASHYGTFDQGGNLWEWNDAVFVDGRGFRGNAFNGGGDFMKSSVLGGGLDPSFENSSVGFRVSSPPPIPEPSTYAAILGCLVLAIATVRRKGRQPISDCR